MAKAGKDITTTGKVSAKEFAALPVDEKRAHLQTVTPKERMDLIIGDPEGKRLVRAMDPQEFFWLVKEIGEADSMEMMQLATAEQIIFILDMEVWDGWAFSQKKACEWVGHLVESGKPRVHEFLKKVDFEFLLLFLGRELAVGGGIGDLADDEERFADYDQSFDNVFFLTFKNPQHSRLIGTFVSMLLELDKELYTSVLEGIKGGIDVELEEDCQRFRAGRLQDLGFPPLEEAVSIYGRVNPESFELSGTKELYPTEGRQVVPFSAPKDSLLLRALARTTSTAVMQELNYLVNNALVAEGQAFQDSDRINDVLQRVYGYLNIALERLTSGDEARAAEVLVHEELKRLFQLGFSVVLNLKFAAETVQSSDYASGKVLAGLKQKRPRFYRGLDPDGIDGYREFRDVTDVQRVADFLAMFHG
ncbi:DUF6178 family protein [Geomesophilobacter sediminis]|uniref:Uncharacterized protein n=1 Tax=Geomesophilobacter sediminis TaxID=2798584 RepID=A0A8J7IMV6_9BACT|nr:DUF6178 family protein [Geomesophilobacter sediminis]MBJ6723184.1 hypothetical protein [Geomesophilobacter sediminis]